MSVLVHNPSTVGRQLPHGRAVVVDPNDVGGTSDSIAYLNSTFIARLQSHLPGSKTPYGLWKDVLATIPATIANDPIRAWNNPNVAPSVLFTEPTNFPTLQFDANGYPVVRKTGVNSVLKCSASIDPQALFAVAKGARDGVSSGTVFSGSTQTVFLFDDSPNGNNWDFQFATNLIMAPQTGNYDVLGMQGGVGTTQISINGIVTPQADDSTSDPGNWTVLNITGGGAALPKDMKAAFFCNQAYNSTDFAAINSYLATL